MLAKLRYVLSRIFPEKQKFSLTLFASHVSYFFLKALKGVAPLWEKDPKFLDLYRQLEGRILLDKARAYSLYQLARMQSAVMGDYLELGAYRCGATLLLTAGDELSEKTIFIIDSFEGLPEITIHDPYWSKGDMGNPDLDEIHMFLSRSLIKTKFEIVRGFFPDQIDLTLLPNSYALVHIDTDLYKPTLDGLNFFYPRLSSGGAIVVDDYGNMSCPGVERAVTEFCEANNVKCLFLYTGQALFIKH